MINNKSTALLIAIFSLYVILATPASQAANGPNTINPISPFDEDPAVNNDCNYCHTEGHGSRSDVRGMLNHHESHYSQYLPSPILPGGFQEKSLLDQGGDNLCPRRRNNLGGTRVLRGIRMQTNH